MKLYHYTKFDTFIYKILPKMQLKFSPFSGCNDPFEFYQSVRVKLSRNTIPHIEQYSKEFEKQIKKYKLICFSKDNEKRKGWQLPTMWAHYADNHNGVCLEFDSDLFDYNTNDIPGDIEYVEKIPEYPIIKDNAETIESQIENYIQQELRNLIFFKKFEDWGIENEYRIIRKTDNIEDDFLKINVTLKNVYLGFRASENGYKSIKVKTIECLLKDINDEVQFNLIRDADFLYYENLKELRFVVDENKKTFEKHGSEIFKHLL